MSKEPSVLGDVKEPSALCDVNEPSVLCDVDEPSVMSDGDTCKQGTNRDAQHLGSPLKLVKHTN